VPTENPLFPDANENQQVSILFPTAAPTTTTTTTAAPIVVVTTPRPAPPPVAPVLTEEEEEILFWDFRESIPGEPELDYPIFDKIPVTTFTCDDKIDGKRPKRVNGHDSFLSAFLQCLEAWNGPSSS
jgi:hypothetical protein